MIETLFEDEDLLVINKPAGISCLEDLAEKTNIYTLLKDIDPAFKLAHRLDKSTSGLLVATKNDTAYRYMALRFEEREVFKLYHAVVEGNVPDGEILIDEPIEISGKGRARVGPKGKRSETLVELLKGFRNYSVVNCMPLTGRFHQIRVHLASMGFPLAGDTTYGGSPVLLSNMKSGYKASKGKEERPVFDRPALHALKLRFVSPAGQELELEAPYPDDFERLKKILKKYN